MGLVGWSVGRLALMVSRVVVTAGGSWCRCVILADDDGYDDVNEREIMFGDAFNER